MTEVDRWFARVRVPSGTIWHVPTEEEFAAAIDHFARWEVDNRQIVVRLIPDQLAPPVEIWTADLQTPSSGMSLPVEVMAELSLALASEGAPPPYMIDTRRGYTEWGASGVSEVVELTVGLGLSGIIGNVAYDALRSTVARLARAAREADRYTRRPLGQAEAEERGRWVLRSAFGLTDEATNELVVVGAEHAGDGWLVRYRTGDRRFEVELLEEDGLVTIARSAWRIEE